MDQKQIFKDPEEKKIPKDLDAGSLEEISEESAGEIQGLLDELGELILDSKKFLKKVSKPK
jgi:hypothetical protein